MKIEKPKTLIDALMSFANLNSSTYTESELNEKVKKFVDKYYSNNSQELFPIAKQLVVSANQFIFNYKLLTTEINKLGGENNGN